VVVLLQHPTQPVPVLQRHLPPEQAVPALHTVPHAPQLALSFERSTQPALQEV
jgi:hypothetical protein